MKRSVTLESDFYREIHACGGLYQKVVMSDLGAYLVFKSCVANEYAVDECLIIVYHRDYLVLEQQCP